MAVSSTGGGEGPGLGSTLRSMADRAKKTPTGPSAGPRKLIVTRLPPAAPAETPGAPLPAYRKFLQILYDAVVITDPAGAILEVNTRAGELFGYEAAKMTGLPVLRLIRQDNDSLWPALQQNVDAQRCTRMEGVCRRADGQEFAAEIAVSRDRLGDRGGFCFFFRDISERKAREDALLTVHTAVQNTATGIVVAGITGHIAYANPAFLRLWGYPEGTDLTGKDVRIYFEKADDVNALFQAAFEHGTGTQEVKARRPNGTFFPARVAATVNADSDDVISGVVLSIEDVTPLHQAQEMERRAIEKQIESERIQARLDTVTTLGYAINNPLQSLLSLAELEKNAQIREQVDRIIAIVKQLQKGESLRTIQDGDGRVRFDIPTPGTLTPCAEKAILLVDDEEMILDLFEHIVKSAFPGSVVEKARHGKQAVALFTKNHHSVVVCDVQMPGMSGEDVYSEMKSFCANNNWDLPRLAFCTGFLPSPAVQEFVADGRNVIVTKPVTSQHLVEALTKLLPTRG